MIKDDIVKALSELAARWSREAAARSAQVPSTPGRSILKADVTAAALDRLDRCAEELRIELARWT